MYTNHHHQTLVQTFVFILQRSLDFRLQRVQSAASYSSADPVSPNTKKLSSAPRRRASPFPRPPRSRLGCPSRVPVPPPSAPLSVSRLGSCLYSSSMTMPSFPSSCSRLPPSSSLCPPLTPPMPQRNTSLAQTRHIRASAKRPPAQPASASTYHLYPSRIPPTFGHAGSCPCSLTMVVMKLHQNGCG